MQNQDVVVKGKTRIEQNTQHEHWKYRKGSGKIGIGEEQECLASDNEHTEKRRDGQKPIVIKKCAKRRSNLLLLFPVPEIGKERERTEEGERGKCYEKIGDIVQTRIDPDRSQVEKISDNQAITGIDDPVGDMGEEEGETCGEIGPQPLRGNHRNLKRQSLHDKPPCENEREKYAQQCHAEDCVETHTRNEDGGDEQQLGTVSKEHDDGQGTGSPECNEGIRE